MDWARDSCWAPVNVERAELVERHHAEWFVAEHVVPGAEVHQERDLTWVVHAGLAWRNAGIMVRFSQASAARRLDAVLERYQEHGRGMALWLSPGATPPNITELLTQRRLRCRGHFPAMVRQLGHRTHRSRPSKQLDIRPVRDLEDFANTPHPSIGPLTTPLRRRAFERLAALVADAHGRTRHYVGWFNGVPVGALEMFLGSECAGIHGLSVLEGYRGRGIGTALIERGCEQARRDGATSVALLATNEGHRLYLRRGFEEVARFGYWYRSFQHRC
jgi:GNAT superfamily N-acetyltransferase